MAYNEKKLGEKGRVVCFYNNPDRDIRRGKRCVQVDSEENYLGFNICNGESFGVFCFEVSFWQKKIKTQIWDRLSLK